MDRTPYDAKHIAIVDRGTIVTALYIPNAEDAKDPEYVLDHILDRARFDDVEVVAEMTRFYKKDGAGFSGWVVRGSGNHSDSIPNKRTAMKNLRFAINEYFPQAAEESTTVTEPQEPTVTDTDFTPGQRIVVADGTVQTVVKMSRWASEPVRVEVEGGLQWLASECVPVPERTDAADRLDRLGAELDRTTAACEEQIERLRAHVPCGHGRTDLRGEHADRIPAPARCESGVTYGLWDEYAGGFTYTGDCQYEVAAEAVTRLTDPASDNYDPDGEYKVLAICRDHEEQPADACEECATEDEN